MTTPDVHAFMRQLDQDPELLEQVRARILTRELLQLPDTVAQIASLQQKTAQQIEALQRAQQQTNERLDSFQQQTNERFDSLQQQTNERFDSTNERLDSLQQQTNERFDSTNERLDSLQQQTNERFDSTNERLDTLQQQTNERFDSTNERLDTLQQQTNERFDSTNERLDSFQQQTNERLDTLTGSVQRIEGTLGNLTGSAYENRAARIAPRLIARYLRMQQAQVLQAPNTGHSAHLDNMVNQSVINGAITDQQAQEIERADIIIMAKDNQDQTIYVVIEASITVDDTDIDRAHERALIMGRLAATAARAAVIGQDISPSNRQRAAGLGVMFMPLSQQ